MGSGLRVIFFRGARIGGGERGASWFGFARRGFGPAGFFFGVAMLACDFLTWSGVGFGCGLDCSLMDFWLGIVLMLSTPSDLLIVLMDLTWIPSEGFLPLWLGGFESFEPLFII